MQEAKTAAGSAEIRQAFERNKRALSLKPAIGRHTATANVRIRDGLTCEIEEGPWRLTVDASPKVGGGGKGPDPGVLGRAALGSCLAMSYARWAAVLGVPVTCFEVEIQTDYDAAGEYGIGNAPADYREVRYFVSVESDAAETEIQRLLDAAEAHTPYLQVFRNPQKVIRILRTKG
jgi:uncharacterized OsmC-like protein